MDPKVSVLPTTPQRPTEGAMAVFDGRAMVSGLFGITMAPQIHAAFADALDNCLWLCEILIANYWTPDSEFRCAEKLDRSIVTIQSINGLFINTTQLK